ncbi:hypothetical protein CEXT_254481 [Caerostris extrusa]|uniref:Uncharacterized protein n=1 Tax=Caerostris extrusa TaxID=172846 RepID=A0AAV4SX54_CAEEX|nr:hypothetical protein CEXT_254481 [Caerostris extrusa]
MIFRSFVPDKPQKLFGIQSRLSARLLPNYQRRHYRRSGGQLHAVQSMEVFKNYTVFLHLFMLNLPISGVFVHTTTPILTPLTLP